MRRLFAVPLLLLLACQGDHPQRVSNENLGIAATFPGEPRLNKVMEDTPFGPIEWFDLTYTPGGRMDEGFHISVGNLPKGKQGGGTVPEVLETMRKWLEYRLSGIQQEELPKGKGPGFHYTAKHASGDAIEGVVVVRQGRLHHAQATVRSPNDTRLRAFIDGFEVTS
jgi:hypothetical protein